MKLKIAVKSPGYCGNGPVVELETAETVINNHCGGYSDSQIQELAASLNDAFETHGVNLQAVIEE